jgi:hypothetical protein
MSQPESSHTHTTEPSKTRTRRSPEPPEAVLSPRPSEPSRELIARRAYELFELRGGDPGRDVEDWLQAEREFADPAREAGMLTREINEPPAN